MNRLAGLESQGADSNGRIETLEGELADANARIDTLESRIGALESAVLSAGRAQPQPAVEPLACSEHSSPTVRWFPHRGVVVAPADAGSRA